MWVVCFDPGSVHLPIKEDSVDMTVNARVGRVNCSHWTKEVVYSSNAEWQTGQDSLQLARMTRSVAILTTRVMWQKQHVDSQR